MTPYQNPVTVVCVPCTICNDGHQLARLFYFKETNLYTVYCPDCIGTKSFHDPRKALLRFYRQGKLGHMSQVIVWDEVAA